MIGSEKIEVHFKINDKTNSKHTITTRILTVVRTFYT